MVKIFRGVGVGLAAYTLISVAVVLGVSTAQIVPDIRQLERTVDRHIAGPGHEATGQRLDKIEADLAKASDTLSKMIGGGMAISGVLVFLQLAQMFGIRPTFGVVQPKGGNGA